MEITDEIRKVTEAKLTDPGQFVVDVLVSARGTQKILVVVDSDNGMTIDQCADISRELAAVLDEWPQLSSSYMLEVSTPGVDQPLKLKRQYKKNIGRKLKVKLAGKTVEGKLLEVRENNIVVGEETGAGKNKEITPLEIQFSDIDKSFVLISFK